MRYSSLINNSKCLEWGLNPSQGALFDLLNQLSSWASTIIIEDEIYYHISRNKILEELPVYYKRTDTIYRHFKDLHKKGLIVYNKYNKKDIVYLTKKGKTWNEFRSSDSFPNKSTKNSDSFPTYNKTINHNNTKEIYKEKYCELYFDEFYKMYPIKKGKAKGKKTFLSLFKKLSPKDSKTLFDKMIKGLEDYCSWINTNISEQKYIKHFSTYMSKRGWEDEYNVKIITEQMNKPTKMEGNRQVLDDIFK